MFGAGEKSAGKYRQTISVAIEIVDGARVGCDSPETETGEK